MKTLRTPLQVLALILMMGVLCAAEAATPATATTATSSKYRKSRLTTDEAEMTADKRTLLLTEYQEKTVELDFKPYPDKNKSIQIGNPAVVVVQPVTGDTNAKVQLAFKPLKAGDTTVSVRDEDGVLRLIFHVKITKSNLSQMATEIKEILRDVEGINIRIVGGKIVVDGEVLVPYDWGRVNLVLNSDKVFTENVINLVSMSSYSLQIIANKIADDVKAFAPNVTTRIVNGVIFLEGNVDNYDQAKKAVDIAFYYLPNPLPPNPATRTGDQSVRNIEKKPIQSFIIVNPSAPKKQDRLVRVTVHFVELSKDYSKSFGFKWQPGFTSGSDQFTMGSSQQGGTAAAGASFTATVSSLFPTLQSLQGAGFARILKMGTTVVRSGQPAKIEENVQIPYAVQDAKGNAAAAQANVGVGIAVTPAIIGQSEDIQMELQLSQTSLASTDYKAGSAPIMNSHKIETRVYVKSNESAAVGAFTSSDIGTDFNKTDPKPGAFEGQTQPLFSLLRSKAYRKRKGQFVVFVTPQIVENASDGTDDLKKNFRVKVK